MAGKKIRIPIPADVDVLVRVEAGFKCSMPRCGTTSGLEIHHIDEDPGNNDPANLLLLCAVCHSRATKREVSRKACRMIKDTLELRVATTADLHNKLDGISEQLEKLVGKEEEPQPLLEEQKNTLAPSPEIDAAAEQAVIFGNAKVPLPAALVRSLVYRLYESGDLERAHALQCSLVSREDALGEDYSNLGVLLYGLKRTEEAEEAYRQAISIDPQNADFWNNLGGSLLGLGRMEEAENAFRQAISVNPRLATAWNNLGVLLQRLDRAEEAEEVFHGAISLAPQLAAAWNNLGQLLQSLGRAQDAERAYHEAIEVNPGAEMLNGLAYYLWRQGRFAEAETEVRKALDADPQHSYTNATLGLLLFERNELEDGRAHYEKAIQLRPDDLLLRQKFHYEYGRALSRDGQADAARIQLEAAKAVDAIFVPLEQIGAELEKIEGPNLRDAESGCKAAETDGAIFSAAPPQILVAIGADKAIATSGDSIVYTVTCTNLGSGLATNVAVSADVDPNARFVSASSGGTYDSIALLVHWNLGTLAGGDSASLTYTVIVK